MKVTVILEDDVDGVVTTTYPRVSRTSGAVLTTEPIYYREDLVGATIVIHMTAALDADGNLAYTTTKEPS